MVNGVVRRRTEAMPHITDDFLDQYAMGTLPEPDTTVFEEHLLTCGECQDRVKAADAYVTAMRSALRKNGTREANDSEVFSSSRPN